MSIKEYNRKRNFKKTPEPPGEVAAPSEGDLRFVIQMHRATRLHFDLRLEMGGVYRSWAVTREPTQNPLDQRLAIFVEDHPIDYGDFEGIIPRGNYGAGTVMLWDRGTYRDRFNLDQPRAVNEAALLEGLAAGKLTFVLFGEKLRGEFALVQLKKSKGNPKAWLLVKKRDQHASFKKPLAEAPVHRSVTTGRTLEEITDQSESAGDVWLPKKGRQTPAKPLPPPPKLVSAKPRLSAPTSSGVKGDRAPKRSALPRRIKPMLPAIGSEAFAGRGWIFTEFANETRIIAEVSRGIVRLHSKQLLPLNSKFAAVAAALREFSGDAVLDGEAAPPGEAFADGNSFRVLDLLYSDGQDWRGCRLEDRLARLRELKLPKSVGMAPSRAGSPADATGPSWGVLAREADSPYRSGISRSWLKIENSALTQSAVAPAPKKSARPGSEVDPLKKIAKRAVAELREPRSRARLDARSLPDPTRKAARQPGDLALTHLDKIYWPADRFTKGDLVEYYRSVAPLILPHLRDRPESLNRHPDGIERPGFFQKDITGYRPRWIKTERIHSGSSGKSIDYFVCNDERSLLYLANLGCIELNPWFSRISALDQPDWMVIDLDPDDNEFATVVEVAHEVHRLLKSIGAPAYLKTSGATGLHIAVPLGARYSFDVVLRFAERIARVIHARMPEVTSVERNPGRRRHKIYLDFMQNRRAQTLAAPYCLRPRPGAPVSTPLKWNELTRNIDPRDFDIQTAPKRFKRVGDLWAPVLGEGISIESCQLELKRFETDQ